MFHAGGGDMDDVMSAFFGGGGGGGMGGGQMRKRKGRDVGHAFPVTLEELYNGKTGEIPRDKTILCTSCKGSGACKPGLSSVCQSCRGQGRKIIRRMMGPGMVQQMQVPCDDCNGEGRSLKEEDKCKACRGNRTAQVEAPLKVVVEKGMEHQTQIPFPGQGDQHPDIDIPGDVIIVLQQMKHDKFTRDGDDLSVKVEISLAQALCGFEVPLTHLDKRILSIKSTPGQMIKPGDKKMIVGEGMPIRGKKTKGDLIVEFDVKFPERLEEGAIAQLRKTLPPPAAQASAGEHSDAELCHLDRQSLDAVKRDLKNAADDDDDDEGQQGPGGVRCAQQ